MVTLRAKAVLFDNDGVLVDSHQQVVAAWTHIADEYDLDIGRLLVELVGVRSLDTLGRYLDDVRALEAVARLEELEVDLAASTEALSGALALIVQLANSRWTIVTSASRRLAEARWTGAGIPIPGATVSADDVSRGKPDPEPFVTGAQRLGVRPEECVVFEDSPAGGQAARAAGARVVAVGGQTWPFEPDARVANLAEVSAQLIGEEVELTLRPPTLP